MGEVSRRGFMTGLFLRRGAEAPVVTHAGAAPVVARMGGAPAAGSTGTHGPGAAPLASALSVTRQVGHPGEQAVSNPLVTQLLADSAVLARPRPPVSPVSSLLDALLGPSAAPEPSRPPPVLPILRPPGAVREAEFLAGCTRCGKCIDACPHASIVLAPARFRDAAGTPMIDPASAPCWMCADTPCITACAPGVLSPTAPLKLGEARIQPHNCLSWQRSFCTVCVERCPVPGAILMEQGRPRVVPDLCTGCGICQHMCPAPVNAVLIMPAQARPLPMGKTT